VEATSQACVKSLVRYAARRTSGIGAGRGRAALRGLSAATAATFLHKMERTVKWTF